MTSNELKAILVEAPLVKVLAFAIGTIGSNVLTGALVFDITNSTKLEWEKAPTSRYFWLLVLLLILSYAYFNFVKDASRFDDDAYCKAYIRAMCLPEATRSVNRALKSGSTDVLNQAKKDLDEFLG